MAYCCETVWRGMARYSCARKGTVERDGKFYCHQHSPQAVEARRRERQARREAEKAAPRTGEVVGTIDITPTWAGILPVLLAAIENGTPEGRRFAISELRRMAQIADNAVAQEAERPAA